MFVHKPSSLITARALSINFAFLFVMLQNAGLAEIPIQPPSVQISTIDSRYFEAAGKTFIPVGPNICFPRFERDEERVFALYESQFRKLHANGGNYTRIFLGAPFWEIEHEKSEQYDLHIIKRLTRILSLAEQYDIRIKFCIEHFRKIDAATPSTNNLISFTKPVYSEACGGPLSCFSDFFNTEQGRNLYRHRAAFLAGFFRGNPQIFAWELWNEINSVGTNSNYIAWTDVMLKELHALLPGSLIVQNMGSFDTDDVRETYQKIMTRPGNDYAQIHRYLDPGAELAVCKGPMDILASDAVQELRQYVIDRPVVLSEAGAVERKHAGPSVLYESDQDGIILHDSLFAPFFSGAAGPGQPWHWTYYIDKNDLWWQFGRFTKSIRGFDPAMEHAVPIRMDQQNFRVYALKGSKTSMIWIRDAKTDWKTELVEKIPAPINPPVVFDCGSLQTPPDAQAFIYDPWEDQWSREDLINGEIRLPPFTRSLVIKIEKPALPTQTMPPAKP